MTTVNLRIEGPDCTLFHQNVLASGHPITLPSDPTARKCDGCKPNEEGCRGGNTFTSTLDDAVISWDGTWHANLNDFLITSIEGNRATATSFWQLYIDGVPAKSGGCLSKVTADNSLLAALGNFPLSPFSVLYASLSTNRVGKNQPVTATVWTGNPSPASGVPVRGATVSGYEQTGGDGTVVLRFPNPATKRLKAARAGFIRSVVMTLTITA